MCTGTLRIDKLGAQGQLVNDWLALTGDSFIVHMEACQEPDASLRYILMYLLTSPTVTGGKEE